MWEERTSSALGTSKCVCNKNVGHSDLGCVEVFKLVTLHSVLLSTRCDEDRTRIYEFMVTDETHLF